MIKKLFYRWINPELQKQNEALIWQIDKLVAEKHMLINECNERDHEISRYEAYVDTLESQVIYLSGRSFSSDK